MAEGAGQEAQRTAQAAEERMEEGEEVFDTVMEGLPFSMYQVSKQSA